MTRAGWRDIASRVWFETFEDRLMLVAAGLAFYALLALVPGLKATMAIYGLFADTQTVGQHFQALSAFVPAQALSVLDQQLGQIVGQGTDALGLTSVLSLAVSLWAANAGMKALFEAMNVVFEQRETRSFLRFTVLTLLATGAAIALFITALMILVALPSVLPLLGITETTQIAAQVTSAAVLLAVVWLALVGLYRWGPDRRAAQWRWLVPGATLSVLAGAIVSAVFSWYLNNIADYDAMYGSLGAIIAVMTWVWIMLLLMLVGAELNAEIEHQTRVDTTIGPQLPLGQRGATMADSVGHSARQAQQVTTRQPSAMSSPRHGAATLVGAALVMFAVVTRRR